MNKERPQATGNAYICGKIMTNEIEKKDKLLHIGTADALFL